ncbi:DUF6894 family protein [Microvirga massiliensis]|uniref:DUF6894 family protein n=1 Tax=Microvirga massiliensis TaxID=1033741 RepID=UPI00062BBAD3|nr:hypothetical protein [Microvirga massiliensis]
MARYYFHLVDRHEIIRGEKGLEVADLATARREAMRAIEEVRSKSPSTAANWKGWRLDVADAAGTIVFSISLDDPLH